MAILNNLDIDLYVPTLNVFLNDKAKRILATLTLEQKADYITFKEAILKEFHITSKNCYKSFKMAVKRPDESYTQFSSRLSTLFTNYLTSRKIGLDYKRLFDLCLSDRFLESLTLQQRYHISDRENEGEWSPITRLATLVDHYVAERSDNEIITVQKSVNQISRPTNEIKKSYFCANCGPGNHSTNFCRKVVTTGGGAVSNSNQNKWKSGNAAKAPSRNFVNKFNTGRTVHAVSVVEESDLCQVEEEEIEEEEEVEDLEIKEINRVELVT